MSVNGDTLEIRTNAKKIAGENIGYILGYYENDKAKKWFDIIDLISHPFFGNNMNINNEEAFNMGMQLGEQLRTKTNE